MVNSIDYVLRFLKKLCRSLHCENLFSDQPISQRSGGSYPSDGLSAASDSALVNRLIKFVEFVFLIEVLLLVFS